VKPKILTLTTVYPSRSEPEMGVFVRTRLRHMADGAEIKVLTPIPIINYGRRHLELGRTASGNHFDGRLEVISSRWFYPPAGGALNAVFLFLSTIWPVARIRRRFPFEIIDAHFAHPEGVAAALLALIFRCPFTITLRGNEQMHGRQWLRRRWMGWALRRAGRVIAVSENLRMLALELGVEPSRSVTIPNGIEKEIFYPHDRQSSRTEYGISGKTHLIVSAGHLIELKGHHRIVRAVRGLVDDGVDVQLRIAGGKGRGEDYEPALRKEITDLGLENRVQMLGRIDRPALARLISAADVFCLASSREGWPNVIHEALACGTPVVATNVGAVPQMIASERYGIVVPPDNLPALQAALAAALSKTWERRIIAERGQTRSWPQVAAEVLRQMEAVREEFTSAKPNVRG
jgi:teichuronic acid biosynthesis glycosyltransferase TuaC